MTPRHRFTLALLLPLLTVGCQAPANSPQAAVVPATRPAVTKAQSPVAAPYILHLPGIGGPLSIDRALSTGLSLAHLPDLEIYDWTDHDPGLHALTAYERNQRQAEVVAEKLTAQYRAHPDRPIIVTSHSGGTGIAVWALEKCPPEVKVRTLLLMASALSPGYDLSPALSHVTGHAYAFFSPHDNIVLGTGTSTFGTIDRVYTQAAGMVGFQEPKSPKVSGQYEKLIPMPYTADWMVFGNTGDHIGPMRRAFASQILSPLLGGTPPSTSTRPASRPTRP
jgi:pimeloyl-ACP methyl ester carboxylesterase